MQIICSIEVVHAGIVELGGPVIVDDPINNSQLNNEGVLMEPSEHVRTAGSSLKLVVGSPKVAEDTQQESPSGPSYSAGLADAIDDLASKFVHMISVCISHSL